MISPPDLHQRLAHTLIAAMKTRHTRQADLGQHRQPGTRRRRHGRRARRAVPLLPHRRDPQPGPRGREDLQAMENELAATELDWCALRPIKLTDGPLTGHVHASAPLHREDHLRATSPGTSSTLPKTPTPAPNTPPSSPPPAERRAPPTRQPKISLSTERPAPAIYRQPPADRRAHIAKHAEHPFGVAAALNRPGESGERFEPATSAL